MDTWYLVKAEGSQNLWPIVPKQGEIDITPLGFTNPVWVDIDKNGFQTERDRARLFLKASQHNLTEFDQKYAEKDWWFQRQLLAVVEKNSALELTALKSLLNSESFSGRQYAYKHLGEIGNTNAAQLLTTARQHQSDPNDLRLIDAYLSRMVPGMDKTALINRTVPIDDQRLRLEIVKILSTGQYEKEWFMAGPFDNENDKGLETPFAPENGVDLADEYEGKNNQIIKWQKITANQAGYIDLTSKISKSDQCVAYAYLVSAQKRRVI